MSASLLKVSLLIIIATFLHLTFEPPHYACSDEIVDVVNLGERIFSAAISIGFLHWWQTFVILLSHSNSSWADSIQSHICPSTPSPSGTTIGPDSLRSTPYFLIALVTVLFGSLLRIICFRTLGTLFTFRVAIRKDHRLITSGPYAYVRHPAYLGLNLVSLAIVHAIFSRGSYLSECLSAGWMAEGWVMLIQVLVIFPGTHKRAIMEDELMKKQFGKEWEEWARSVRYRIYPGIW